MMIILRETKKQTEESDKHKSHIHINQINKFAHIKALNKWSRIVDS